MAFSRFILPAFVALNLWIHGASAVGQMRQGEGQTLENRGIRNADYNANGPLPKVDTGNNRTMDSGPSEASMRSPRDVKTEYPILQPRLNVVAGNQPQHDLTLNYPSRRAPQTPKAGPQKMRIPLVPRAKHGDPLTFNGNVVKNSRGAVGRVDRPASSVSRRHVSVPPAKAKNIRSTLPTQAPPSY